MRVLGYINCCCKVIKLSSSWEIWGVSGELLYDLSNEVEIRLGSLGKHKKEWKRMGVDDWMGLIEKGVLKTLRIWSGYR